MTQDINQAVFICTILTSISTSALAIFGGLQCWAVYKQNSQNLFKIRVEYFMEHKIYLSEVFTLFGEVIKRQEEPPNSISKNKCILELCGKIKILSEDAAKCSKEIEYLYSKELSKKWNKFFAEINVLSEETYNNTSNPLKSDMVELLKTKNNITDMFDKILKI